MDWKSIYEDKLCSPEEAVSIIESGDTVYIGFASSMSVGLTDYLAARREELFDVTLVSHLLNTPLKPFDPSCDGHFRCLSFFMGASDRRMMARVPELSDYVSLHLSQNREYLGKTAHINAVILEVSPPDERGFMSFGPVGVGFYDVLKSGLDKVILQVNRFVPVVTGEGTMIHVSEADRIAAVDEELMTIPVSLDSVSEKIASYVCPLIPDGACLQLGIGSVANAIGYGLMDKNDLGVHTEMFVDSMMDLIKHGNITNRKKSLHPGISIAGFAGGTRELYDFIDHREDLCLVPFDYVNDPRVIALNDRMVSVNSAMAIDLYGQVAADNIGGRQHSGVGGQLDFVRGAQMARFGMSFIAMTSVREGKNGPESRIVIDFPPCTAITTPRSDVEYVATEYGCINLKLLPMKERAKALISLAHPDFRDELSARARELKMI